jgi:hypothetical protein
MTDSGWFKAIDLQKGDVVRIAGLMEVDDHDSVPAGETVTVASTHPARFPGYLQFEQADGGDPLVVPNDRLLHVIRRVAIVPAGPAAKEITP